MEMVIKEQLTAYFESNSIFSTAQYGFRRNFSTVDALEKLISSIISGFDEHKSTLTILCDLSKAFDCVSHTILINKLQYYGITGKELDLFKSYDLSGCLLHGTLTVVSLKVLSWAHHCF